MAIWDFLYTSVLVHGSGGGRKAYPAPPIPTSATLAAGIAHYCSICSNKVSLLAAGLRSTKSTSRRKGTVDDGDGGISDPTGTAGVIVSIANADERGYLRFRDFLIFLCSRMNASFFSL
jgi:hypothetical protein